MSHEAAAANLVGRWEIHPDMERFVSDGVLSERSMTISDTNTLTDIQTYIYIYIHIYIHIYIYIYIYISADPSNLQGERAREKAFPGFWALSKSFSSGFRKQR